MYVHRIELCLGRYVISPDAIFDQYCRNETAWSFETKVTADPTNNSGRSQPNILSWSALSLGRQSMHDFQDKNGLIPFMDLIYNRAFLTIVAATGQDSEVGLPGLRRGTRYERQKIEELKPGLRVTSPKHLSDALEES